MRMFKVTNRTQGQMEIKSIGETLVPSGWVIVPGPLADDIKFMMGGGPMRKLDVQELPAATPAKTSTPTPAAASSEQSNATPKSGKNSKP